MSAESSFAAAVKPLTGMADATCETSIAPTRAVRATRVILTCFMGDSSVLESKMLIVFVAPYEHADAPHAVALLRVRRERPCRRASQRDYEFSSCNRDSHWTPLRQVSTLSSGTIPCFGGCMNPLIQPPSRPDACYGS